MTCNFIVLLFLIFNCTAQNTVNIMLRIKEKNLSVAYQRTGNGPALVLLHGFIVDSRSWELQIKSLSKYFTIIAWDAPGTGQSDDPPDIFTISDWADVLSRLLDSCGIEKAHILGLSWGGILAQEFYHRHADRVSSLVLADTYAGWQGSLPKSTAEQRLASCLRDASLPPAEFVPKYLPGMFSDSSRKETQEKMTTIMSDFHPAGFRLMAMSSNIDTRKILPTIELPTLLIWGELDKRSPISVAHQMLAAIPGAKLEIIKGAGHVSNLEAPDRFNEIVRDFCLMIPQK
jgi:pimeloyl-ACP methyl ester carboxylesterase